MLHNSAANFFAIPYYITIHIKNPQENCIRLSVDFTAEVDFTIPAIF